MARRVPVETKVKKAPEKEKPRIHLVDRVFGPEGLLSKRFPGYEAREGQVEMAKLISVGHHDAKHVVCEAGTGTGKSFAYLVPAIEAASEMDRRTVVVTANIALQEQLFQKDLPFLADLLRNEPDVKFTFALAKGLNNYLCKTNLEDQGDGPINLFGEDLESWEEAVEWAGRTETGDLSELTRENPKVRKLITISSDECPGNACRASESCFGRAARKRWRSASIVVTNYHLFFLDLAARSAGAKGILPTYQAVVFDEAHKAVDIARDFFGFEFSQHAITRLSKATEDSDLIDAVEVSVRRYFAQLTAHRDSKRYKARIKEKQVASEAPELVKKLQLVASTLATNAEDADNETKHRLLKKATRADQLAYYVGEADGMTNPNAVYFIGRGDRVTLESKLIDPGPVINGALFNHPDVKTVCLTSATLASKKGDFKLVRSELGVPGEAVELTAESPFDWSRVACVVPSDMPNPQTPEYKDAVARKLVEAIRAARGRTLGLFTSKEILNHATLAARRAGFPYRILNQYDGPRSHLIKTFKEDVDSVLLGTESFWAGVDVPGESLSCVVIDRLPFVNPNDPIADAIGERDPKAFWRWFLPNAIRQLKQGVGRLIRSASDRGALVILDPRIYDKPYGSDFLEALPEGIVYSDDLAMVKEAVA